MSQTNFMNENKGKVSDNELFSDEFAVLLSQHPTKVYKDIPFWVLVVFRKLFLGPYQELSVNEQMMHT